MKKCVKYLFPVIFLLVSCSKEKSFEKGDLSNGGSTVTHYFIKCKIDGIAKTFDIASRAIKRNLGNNQVSFGIFGKAVEDINNFESINFNIQTNLQLSPGNYTVSHTTLDYVLAGVYNPNSISTLYASAVFDISPDPFQVTITSISNTDMGGSFTGNLFSNIPGSNTHNVVITEGEFKSKF